jgi:hypothetical protein
LIILFLTLTLLAFVLIGAVVDRYKPSAADPYCLFFTFLFAAMAASLAGEEVTQKTACVFFGTIILEALALLAGGVLNRSLTEWAQRRGRRGRFQNGAA